jgi:SAM-dependent methyltransferase
MSASFARPREKRAYAGCARTTRSLGGRFGPCCSRSFVNPGAFDCRLPAARFSKAGDCQQAQVGAKLREVSKTSLYGPKQSRFARLLERRELRRPDPVARELRRRLLGGLTGRVVEIGCGDGRAFEHYPPEVEAVLAVEPDPVARALAEQRANEAAVPIEVADGTADRLPAKDGAFDAAVLVCVLCSVPEPVEALREIRRVLVPDGELRFYEHVRSPHKTFLLLQRTVDSLYWTRALGGCRTTRDTEAAIPAEGFSFTRLEHGFHSSSFLTVTSGPYILGIARREPRPE